MISSIFTIADRARLGADGLPLTASSPFKMCLWLLVLIGVTARLLPFVDIDNRLFWQYITEDGYLMQTVARNMAIGLGMSTAEGTIPTNGVQPLAVFLYTSLHFVAGGSKLWGIIFVTAFSILVAVVAGYYLYKVAALVFSSFQHGGKLAAICAASWFAAPHTITHSMNGLETGIYFAAILFTLNYYLSLVSGELTPLSSKQRIVFGILLGVTFLARNDAVFFIGGLLFAHLLLGGKNTGGGYFHRLNDCLVAGAVSILVALPWLINNYALFGSIVPISGISESRDAHFGQNLISVPATVFGSAFIYTPVPGFIQRAVPIILLSLVCILLSLSGFWFFAARLTIASRRFFLGGLIFALCITSYYGLFFGAPHFLGRYIYPLSLFFWIASTATIFFLLSLLFRATIYLNRAVLSIVLLLTFGAVAFAYSDFSRGYSKGTSQMHRQVVKWVQENVPEHQWVGAPQTGTLGFFHDKTLNLDGKVNPAALRAILQKGHVLEYARASEIAYIVDWYGIADWVKMESDPRFAKEFEVVIRDEQTNLSVMRRIHHGPL